MLPAIVALVLERLLAHFSGLDRVFDPALRRPVSFAQILFAVVGAYLLLTVQT